MLIIIQRLRFPGGLNFNMDEDGVPAAAALAEAAQLGRQEPANDPAAPAAVDEAYAMPFLLKGPSPAFR